MVTKVRLGFYGTLPRLVIWTEAELFKWVPGLFFFTDLSSSLCLLSCPYRKTDLGVMKTHSQRLLPGDDLYLELLTLAKEWPAACLLSCVGSLKLLSLRLAGAEQEKMLQGPFEILSLSGTCCPSGLHLHICVADKEGRVFGGHLKQGSIIETTAEIVVGILDDTCFTREADDETGYLELVVKKASQASS